MVKLIAVMILIVISSFAQRVLVEGKRLES